MPTYSYKCTECGTAFDIHQDFTDSTLTVCPNCSGKLRKVFTAVGVSFNGSGFYRNDSRPSEKSSDASSSAGSEAKQSEAKPSDSKPGTKSDGTKSGETKSAGSKSGESKPAASASTPAASGTKAAG